MRDINQENSLLTLNEASEFLSVKPITLRKWDREGKLISVRIGSRRDRRYRLDSLKEFLAATQTPKINWQEYIRSGVTFHKIEPTLEGLFDAAHEYFGLGIKYLMAYFDGDTLYWHYDLKDLSNWGKFITDLFINQVERKERFFRDWDERTEKILDFIDKSKVVDFPKLDLKQCHEIYSQYVELLKKWYVLTMSIDGFDQYLGEEIDKQAKVIVKKILGENYTEKDFIEFYNTLTMPENLSYISQERLDLLKLANKIKLGQVSLGSFEFQGHVELILEKYWWTSLGWAKNEAKTFEDVSNAVKEILADGIDLAAELDKLEHGDSFARQAKNSLESKYHYLAEESLMKLVALSDRLVKYHDLRKEVQLKSAYWEFQLLARIAVITGIPENLLVWGSPQEIITLCAGQNIDEQELNQRSTHFIYINNAGKVTQIAGRAAVSEYKRILGSKKDEIRDLQGITASGGKVAGKAFVAITVKSAEQLQPGQILVTGMTTPDFVPYMKKAAAIVTDEGGLTCHAAIISRELGIPCIVGTKQATKVIKTGDLIEVKANHGVVIILKNAQ